MVWLPDSEKIVKFIRFYNINERDRRTDGRTDGQTPRDAICRAMHSIARQKRLRLSSSHDIANAVFGTCYCIWQVQHPAV